jgi:hypothetical protein
MVRAATDRVSLTRTTSLLELVLLGELKRVGIVDLVSWRLRRRQNAQLVQVYSLICQSESVDVEKIASAI